MPMTRDIERDLLEATEVLEEARMYLEFVGHDDCMLYARVTDQLASLAGANLPENYAQGDAYAK